LTIQATNGLTNNSTEASSSLSTSSSVDTSCFDIPEELEASSEWSFINETKTWMISLLRKHGFYGVLLMASFPNVLFDVCGIFCGHYLMPFWTFFGATFIGKVFIRNGYQSIIYIALCRFVKNFK
jgi:membrane protein YqaA with SNARE-associated domain